VIGRIAPGADVKSIEAHMQLELQQWLLSPVASSNPESRRWCRSKPCTFRRAAREFR